MFKNLWLTFAQTCTVLLALFFTLETLRPAWLPEILQRHGQVSKAHPDSHGASFRQAAAKSSPAVVNIYTAKAVITTRNHPFLDDPGIKQFFGDELNQGLNPKEEASGMGSGVIVSQQGHILTNSHVVEAADDIEVTLQDGRTAKASVVGSDPETDLAVIRILLPDLPYLQFADEKEVKVGDVVLAIGNPFGVGQTVTMGIVSALGRNQVGINTFENFIQTDAAINPGNSGGALVNGNGDLLGINTAIYSRSGGSLGIGFAIPGDTARQVLNDLINDGKVTRGYIGIEQQNVTDDLVQAFDLTSKEGVIIAGVVKNGPADTAGLKVGDVLTAIDDMPIRSTSQMLNTIAETKPGTTKEFTVIRKQQKIQIAVEIGTRPSPNVFEEQNK